MTDDKDNKIKELEEENKHLKDELKRLKKIEKEFEEFKSRHSLTVSNLRNALKIKANSHHKPMPLGAPKGHIGYSRHIPERIDHIKVLNPRKCPHCNNILGATQEIRSRHVTDIELVTRAKTTRFDIHRKYCPNCKRLVELEAPNVLPHARFGLNLMLLVMYLRLGLRLPYNKICEYFMTMHNITICEGEIVHILTQLAREFGEYYSYLEKLVKAARIKHTDSTSWRVDGKNYFAWVFIAAGTVIYRISKRNNHKVALALLGKQKGSVLVVDRHSAFRTLAEKTGFLLQLCWSHILVDSKGLATNFGAEGRYVHQKLKDIYSLAKRLNHQGNLEQVEQLKAEVLFLTRRHYRHSTVRRFVDNLYFRDVENLFRFVTDKDIDPTNNISERNLRNFVILRKISNGSRSRRGANATAMLMSIVQTSRMKNGNILQGLQAILKNPSGC